MTRLVTAYNTREKRWEDVQATWVDHPGIFGGRFVSEKPKTVKPKPDPKPVAAEQPLTENTSNAPALGDNNEKE